MALNRTCALLQTALDLAAAGFEPYVAVDAVGSRYAIDHEMALRRMESSGVILTTTETAMFEWCRTADRPEFKKISALAKEVAAIIRLEWPIFACIETKTLYRLG